MTVGGELKNSYIMKEKLDEREVSENLSVRTDIDIFFFCYTIVNPFS